MARRELREYVGDRNWRSAAACLVVDPELFFPPERGVSSAYEEAAAKAVCHGCPVQAECLAWAIWAGVTDGVWGGYTAAELRRVRRSNVA